MNLGILQIPEFAVDRGSIGWLQELRLEGFWDFCFYFGEDDNGKILMHDFYNSAVFFKELEGRSKNFFFFFGIVLKYFVYFKTQRQHYLILLAELKVFSFVLEF